MIVYSGSGSGALLFLLLLLGVFVLLPALLLRGLLRGGHRSVRVLSPGGWQTYPAERRAPAPEPVHRAEVESVVARLAHDVRTLQPGDDPVGRQALADASERYATATGLLERAASADQLRTAWLAAAEGLHATRLVRERLGLDAGPAPALPPASGPQLDRPARVVVEGREHVGVPRYAPGYGHWFPGGPVGDRYVPGGWYAEPFWPGSLVLGVLSGWALGSLMSGALYGGFGGLGGWADGGWADGATDVGGGGWDDGGGFGDVGGGSWGGGDWGAGGGDWGGGGDW